MHSTSAGCALGADMGTSEPKETGDWRARVVGLPRHAKRFVLAGNDFLLLAFALWAGFSLRLSTFYVPESLAFGLLLLSAPVIGVLVFSHLGL